ncbi:MAG: hypothetical protein A2029_17065, partial [Chloroflexi bacterium RBG_19FT_COMBO_47_9]
SIGKRLASLRQKNGLTQQSLADRLAMSRVAVSHIEIDLTIPSERSITLMAGVFKLSPTDLVQGTSYPRAKAERLPVLTTIYTALELNLALLTNDIEWLERLDDTPIKQKGIQGVLGKWYPILEKWNNETIADTDSKIYSKMSQILKGLNTQGKPHLE